MIQLSMIGNLAADAEIKTGNGKNWVTFRLADTRRWVDQNNVKHESTQWASCIMAETKGTLFQYLKKGVKVYVQGSCDIDIYSSPKLRRMIARYNISVQHVELCGGSADSVPRQLADADGLLLDVCKAYFINPAIQQDKHYNALWAANGDQYRVDKNGFVFEDKQDPNAGNSEDKQDPNTGNSEDQLDTYVEVL